MNDGITVALSLSGITKITNACVASQLEQEIANVKVGNQTVDVGNFFSDDEWISNAVVKLTGGAISGFVPAIQTVVQDSQDFTLTFNSSNFTVSFTDWRETFDYKPADSPRSYPGSNNCGAYSFTLGLDITVTTTVAFVTSDNDWNVSVSTCTVSPVNVNAGIPSQSVMQGICTTNPVASGAESAILSQCNFQTQIQSALQATGAAIPDSGNLGNGISLVFALGQAPLTFPPSGTGLTVGVTGVAQYQGNAYPGDGPAIEVPVPTIPDGYDVAFNITDYAFSGLLWAYYSANQLTATYTPQNCSDPGALETNNYAGTALNCLAQYYADMEMQAVVTATAAPNIFFMTTYQIPSAETLVQLKVPQNDADELVATLGSQTFITVESFNQAVLDVIGANDTNQYFSVIEAASSSAFPQGVLTLPISVAFSALTQAQPPVYEPLFTIALTPVFDLGEIAITSSATNQLLTYQLNIVNSGAATLVSVAPNLAADITTANAGLIWASTLWMEFVTQLQVGLPLPAVPGISNAGDRMFLSIQQGYLGMQTDFSFGSS